jgi:hypothetical protein
MALKPEISLPVAIGTGALVWAIYNMNMPKLADVKATPEEVPGQTAAPITGARRVSTAEAVAIVAGVSLLSHDPTVFVIGGAMVVFFDFSYRHANAQNAATGSVLPTAKVSAGINSSGGGAEAMITG